MINQQNVNRGGFKEGFFPWTSDKQNIMEDIYIDLVLLDS